MIEQDALHWVELPLVFRTLRQECTHTTEELIDVDVEPKAFTHPQKEIALQMGWQDEHDRGLLMSDSAIRAIWNASRTLNAVRCHE